MKTRLLICLILPALLFFASNTWAVSVTWTGGTSTLWSVGGNWSGGVAPTSTIDVVIPTGTANLPTIDVASACKSVTITGSTSTTITLSAVLTISGALKINDGCSLTFAGASSANFGVASFVGTNPAAAGGASLTINNLSTVSFGAKLSVEPNCTLVNNGTLGGTSFAPLASSIFTNNGTLNASAAITPAASSVFANNGTVNTTSAITMATASTFTNSSTGIINLTAITSALNFADATAATNSGQIIGASKSAITTGTSGATFTNSSTGVITLSDAAFTMANGSTVNNAGQITLNTTTVLAVFNTGTSSTLNNNSGGTLTLNASKFVVDNGTSFVNSGSFSATNTSTVFVNGDKVSLFATINNSSGANVTLDASTITLDYGCSITNAGTLAANNASTIKLNSNFPTLLVSAITSSSGANLTLNASTLTVSNGCSITSAGTITASNSSTITLNGNSAAFLATLTNNNIFNASSTAFSIDGGSAFKNNGSFTGSACTFNFTSTGGSNITNTGAYQDYGTTYTLPGGGSHILNTNGTFNLGPTSVITPSAAGTYVENDNPGVFTLQSDATGSAAIGKLGTTSSCIGTFNVERFIHGSNDIIYRNYRFFSSPVYTSSQTVGGVTFNSYDFKYLNTSNTAYPITTGTGGTGNGFDKAGNPTIYVYREDRAVNNGVFSGGNYIGVSNITGTSLGYDSYNNTTTAGYLPVGNGFAFFYRGTKADLTGRTTVPVVPASYPNDATVTQVGSLNQGNVPVNLWYNISTPNSVQNTLSFTAGNTTLSQGVNLVGNPYASAIDWNTYFGNTGITSSNVLPTIYIFDPLTKQYDLYMNTGAGTGFGVPASTTSIVPSGQGFFVIATDPAAQLTFTEAAKSSAAPNQSTLLMGAPPKGAYDVRQILRLRLFIDTLNYDDIAIAFNSNSSPKYNNMEDSEYLVGMNAAEGLASFSTDAAPVPLSINFLPLPKKTRQVIRLKVTATNSGRLTLKKTQLDELPPIYELWLMDRYKKDSLDLRHNPDYAFDINKADTGSYGDNRFQIIVRQNKALGIHLLDFTAVKSPDGVPVSWKTENEASYTNFTVERSTDNGVTFDVLGGFASNGQGIYNFTDKNPVNTVDIYRLKIEDLNGDITYSKAITIVYDPSKVVAATTKVNVYPNPASGLVNVAITQQGFANTNLSGVQGINYIATLAQAQKPSYGIKIISITGAVIKTETSATPTWQDNVSALLPGTYFIQVTNNSDNSLVGKSSFVKL